MIVYKHTCLANGKPYIGLTVKTIEARWQEHCSDARRNKKRKFFAALNKYGIENWSHEVLFESDNEQEILDKEVEFIEKFDSIKRGYNTSKDRFRTGIKHNPESIEKMRESQKAAHARRRAEAGDGGWHRKDGGPMKGKAHPNKGKENKKWDDKGKRGWKMENGIRVWFVKEAAV